MTALSSTAPLSVTDPYALPAASPTYRALAAALASLPIEPARLGQDFSHYDRFLLQGEPERALLTVGENWTHLATHDVDRQVVAYDVTRGLGSDFPYFLASVNAQVRVLTRDEALAFVNTLPQWVCFDHDSGQVYVEGGVRIRVSPEQAALIKRAYARPEQRANWDLRSRLTGQLRARSALQGHQRRAGQVQFPEPRMAFADTPIGAALRGILQNRSARPYGQDVDLSAQIVSLNQPHECVVLLTDHACIPLLHREDEALMAELDRAGPLEAYLVRATGHRHLKPAEIRAAITALPGHRHPDRSALEETIGTLWINEINAQLPRSPA